MNNKRNQIKTTSRRRAPGTASNTVTVGLTQMACTADARKNLANQVRLAEQTRAGPLQGCVVLRFVRDGESGLMALITLPAAPVGAGGNL